MRITQVLVATLVACTLAACGQSAPAPQAEPPTAVDLPTPEEQLANTEAVTPDFLVGSWGDNGDCTSVVTYSADGTFRMADGATGRWALAGGRLTMSGERGEFGVQIAKGNDNQLLIGQPDGGFGISQRC
jgi:hypothetical protein